jgi:hypothetical protein
MTTTTACKTWCTDHKDRYEDSCYTSVLVFDSGARTKESALMQEIVDMEAAQVVLTASQDKEDDQLLIDLEFYAPGADQAHCLLHLEVHDLKGLHSELGAVLSRLS